MQLVMYEMIGYLSLITCYWSYSVSFRSLSTMGAIWIIHWSYDFLEVLQQCSQWLLCCIKLWRPNVITAVAGSCDCWRRLFWLRWTVAECVPRGRQWQHELSYGFLGWLMNNGNVNMKYLDCCHISDLFEGIYFVYIMLIHAYIIYLRS